MDGTCTCKLQFCRMVDETLTRIEEQLFAVDK